MGALRPIFDWEGHISNGHCAAVFGPGPKLFDYHWPPWWVVPPPLLNKKSTDWILKMVRINTLKHCFFFNFLTFMWNLNTLNVVLNYLFTNVINYNCVLNGFKGLAKIIVLFLALHVGEDYRKQVIRKNPWETELTRSNILWMKLKNVHTSLKLFV